MPFFSNINFAAGNTAPGVVAPNFQGPVEEAIESVTIVIFQLCDPQPLLMALLSDLRHLRRFLIGAQVWRGAENKKAEEED